MKGLGQSFNFFNLTKAKKDVFPANFAAEKTPNYIIRARAKRRKCVLVEDVAVVLHIGTLKEFLHETRCATQLLVGDL